MIFLFFLQIDHGTPTAPHGTPRWGAVTNLQKKRENHRDFFFKIFFSADHTIFRVPSKSQRQRFPVLGYGISAVSTLGTVS